MKIHLLRNLLLSALVFTLNLTFAARIPANNIAGGPSITYLPLTNVYTVGTAISGPSTLSSGVSAAGTYGTGTAFGSGYSGPEDLAFDPSGNLFVTNITNNTIRKFNSSGTLTATYTGFNLPYGISLDAAGNAYVSNTGNNTIIKITPAGVQSTFISTGLSNPVGSAIDANGNLYVANEGNNTVKEFNSSGALVQTISLSYLPSSVDVDNNGNIYVLNYTAGVVNKYNSAGVLQSTLTPNVSGLALSAPGGLTIDASGNIYIADSNNNRILEYNSSYTLIANVATGTGSTPRGAAIDAAGNLYGALLTSGTVLKYVPTGGWFISQPLPAGLSFNSSTGAITGTPATILASTNFTVYAYNSSGVGSVVINITINPAAPTAPATSSCGAATQTITASGGMPSGGTYNWYTAAAGGTLLQSSTSATYSPSLVATTTYYVSYSSGGLTSARTAVTATVNPIVSNPVSGAAFSYPFSGNAADISGSNNTGIVGGAALTTDRYGAANSAYSFNGSSNYITTTVNAISPGIFSISLWFKYYYWWWKTIRLRQLSNRFQHHL